jgi:hypothetical protein
MSIQRADETLQMAYASSLTKISLGDKVRFTEERLSVLTPPDRKRLEGRIGVVEGYWNFSRKLTVHFPEDAGRRELRILSVDPRQLEQVRENLIKTDMAPEIADTSSGDEKLSQDDLDKLFD